MLILMLRKTSHGYIRKQIVCFHFALRIISLFSMSQTERISFIGRTCVERGGVSLKEIASQFGVTERTAGRDIEYMRDRMEAPIVFNRKNHRYELTKPWGDYINIEERMIILSAYMNSLLDTIPLDSTINDDLKKTIADGMSLKGRRVVEKVEYRAQSIDLPDYSVFRAVTEAISRNCALRISYSNIKDEYSEDRIIEPIRLINYSTTWYIVAFDHKRDTLRSFHLSRVESIELEKKVEIRNIPASELNKFLYSSFGIFFGKESQLCTIHFTGIAAKVVSSQVWHKDQKMTKNEDGSVDLIVPASNYEELINRTLSFRGEAKPVAPEKFVSKYNDIVEQMYLALLK